MTLRALDFIAGHPWAITEQGLALIVAVATRDGFFADARKQAIQAYEDEKVEGAHTAEVRDGIGIMLVRGALFRHASMFSNISSATSYGELRKDFQSLLDDDSIKGIVWDFDSPGGEVNGVAELADAIYKARGKKPMVAYASGLCASAAYWLASAVGDIYCSPTSELGSIGCKMLLVDESKKNEMEGRKEIAIVSSQSPAKASDPNDGGYLARLQRQCDELADVFIRSVATYRDVTPDFVTNDYGHGDVMVGARCVESRLCEGTSDFEAVLSKLQDRVGAAKKSNYMMGAKANMDSKAFAKFLRLDEGASERQIEDRAQALVQVSESLIASTGSVDTDEALGKVKAGMSALAELEQVKAEREREQVAATQAKYKAALADGFKTKKLTLGEAKTVASLLNEKAQSTVEAALEGAEATQEAVIAALCAAPVSAKALKRVEGFLAAKSPALPEAKKEPPLDQAHGNSVIMASEEQLRKIGIDPEAYQKHGAHLTVEHIHKAAKQAPQAK